MNKFLKLKKKLNCIVCIYLLHKEIQSSMSFTLVLHKFKLQWRQVLVVEEGQDKQAPLGTSHLPRSRWLGQPCKRLSEYGRLGGRLHRCLSHYPEILKYSENTVEGGRKFSFSFYPNGRRKKNHPPLTKVSGYLSILTLCLSKICLAVVILNSILIFIRLRLICQWQRSIFWSHATDAGKTCNQD